MAPTVSTRTIAGVLGGTFELPVTAAGRFPPYYKMAVNCFYVGFVPLPYRAPAHHPHAEGGGLLVWTLVRLLGGAELRVPVREEARREEGGREGR